MKAYDIRIKTTGEKKGSRIIREESAKITIYDKAPLKDSWSLSDIVEFVDGIKKVYSEAMKATKRGDFIEFEVTSSTYDETDDNRERLIQKTFDRWFFEGYNDDPDGIYLSPDVRYTNENHDLYLTKNILHDLDGI